MRSTDYLIGDAGILVYLLHHMLDSAGSSNPKEYITKYNFRHIKYNLKCLERGVIAETVYPFILYSDIIDSPLTHH